MNKTYDDLLQEVQTLRGQLEESERRGDELTAHVECFRQEVGFLSLNDFNDPEKAQRIWNAYNSTPAASLAAHDANVRANAWRECGNNIQAIIDFIDQKHDENPNYPIVCYDAMSEYVQDVLRGADNIERGES